MPISVESEKCIGCKLCIIGCPDPNVLTFKPEEKKVFIDVKRCKSCGLCVEICPKKALAIASTI